MNLVSEVFDRSRTRDPRRSPQPWHARPRADGWDERPIREELFSAERLEEHARSLATAQKVAATPVRQPPLSRRLADNDAVLLSTYRDIATAIEQGVAITPAAEWLVDNYHVVEKQIREIRADLPVGYYRELPKLAEGHHLAGYPRVLGVAWALVAHTDSHFEPEVLRRFVRAYQEVEPLTIGELWAVPITLRWVLVENLRRLAERVMLSRAERRRADELADRLLGTGGRDAEPIEAVLGGNNWSAGEDAFYVQLIQRLRDQDPSIGPALTWLDEQLERRGATTDSIVRDEHQRQVAGSVTVRNIITSMRLVTDVDWTEVVERISLVDDIFAEAGGFREMDFATRNLYRSAVEALARGSGRSELEIARAAVSAAEAERTLGGDPRREDPGYHLIAGARRRFEVSVGFRPSTPIRLARAFRGLGVGGYAACGALVSALLLGLPLAALAAFGVSEIWLWVLGALGLVPAIDAAVALVNAALTRSFHATILPALALKEGVPTSLRTLVAVPTLLTSREGVEAQIERLQIHHLSSPDGDISFALLSDWADAPTEQTDSDEELLAAARDGIERLNRQYGPAPAGKRFLLLHRRRVWSECEGCWLGWERKRGKLRELNRLLRGAEDTTFLAPAEVPPDVRYVITLDSDTRVPRDAVRRLIGKMAHPINHPRLDPALGRVVEGYGVLQPRVTPALPVGHEGSLFLRVFSRAGGIDPYAAAVSDIYQDLFAEGSYTGKGIYDVDAFEAALAGRVPESSVLSHDLFEGVFARAGLVSDVEVIEDFPARYDTAALRHHRWARGDWQLLPWIVGRGPAASERPRSDVPMTGRWKMLDNLRRTLSPPSMLLALAAGWMLPAGPAAIWTLFVLSMIFLPAVIPLATSVMPPRSRVVLRAHVASVVGELRLVLLQACMMVTFLAHQTSLMGDAILRTLVRLYVTRRRLLEWVPAAQAAFGPRPTLSSYYRRMMGALVIAAGAAFVSWSWGRGAWPLAAAFGALWCASPAFALWASRSPRTEARRPLEPNEARMLRLIARSTWRFFETFVGPDDNNLPPDNFQETPKPALARRTSPTNMGLYLLATVTAADFGWIGIEEAVERLEATLSVMARLARHRGHFYNWYDTRDLRPLEPAYVSSVDSGNLAGHLIALANACPDWASRAAPENLDCGGVADALEILRGEAERVRSALKGYAPLWREFDASLVALADEVGRPGRASEPRIATLREQAEALVDAARAVAVEAEGGAEDMLFWAGAANAALESILRDLDLDAAGRRAHRLTAIEQSARAMAQAMDFRFLIDPDRMLLSIGFRVEDSVLDPSCYDMLASEARLASFMAIAKGDAPARHWFRLSHAVTPVAHGAALISWSGSMFEYLMPSLVMRAPSTSLLEETCRLVVRRQIRYGEQLGKPWGVSESAYNARDLEFTYQYSNFGVPSLGLKRGLGDDVVVAPYATALAAMVDPAAAARNFRRLREAGAQGRYGCYEALDYTPGRVPDGQSVAVVRTFMAHHQGMTIVALADALLDGRMRSRFHAEPMVQATELLLQERIPREVAVTPPSAVTGHVRVRVAEVGASWRSADPRSAAPEVQLLSNGRYSVMLTAAGSGWSSWRDLAVTRWREDATCDDWGCFIYLRDAADGRVWSAGLQPVGAEPDAYEVIFNEDRAEIARTDDDLTTNLQVLVSAEDDAEVRRLTLSNTGTRTREVEVTSYLELVLAPQAADVAHPAFSKLFVETEHVAGPDALLATRRRRSPDEPEVWAAHLAVDDGKVTGKREFETDRARFLGRGRDAGSPAAVSDGRPLYGATGAVLDPIFALRRHVRIAPGETARIDFWTIVAASRAAVLEVVDRHNDTGAFDRAAALAWTQSQVQLHHLAITRSEAAEYQRLAGHMVYASPAARAPSDAITSGLGPQSGVWPMGISGDLPIMLVRVADIHELGLLRQALEALEYWAAKGLATDLVILNEHGASYAQALQVALETLVRASQSRPLLGDERRPGHIFIVRADLITQEAKALLAAVARVVLVGERGGLADQLSRLPDVKAPAKPTVRRVAPRSGSKAAPVAPELEFFNGLGGFTKQGAEYMTVLRPGQSTPAPWIHVVANPTFGFQVSCEGGGYAWSMNSREHQLTPWSNDPVTDRPGQAIYLRDEDTGEVWSATAQPIRNPEATYFARYGAGYSRLEHESHGLNHDLLEYVPLADPIKISRLKLANVSGRTRRLSVTAYAEWVLGPARGASASFVASRIDPETGAITATNRWRRGFECRVAFLDLGGRQTSVTADRREFLGRNGSLASPLALAEPAPLSGRAGAGLDPCAALQMSFALEPGESVEIPVFLGDGADDADAIRLIKTYRQADLEAVLLQVSKHWDHVLGAVKVSTPDRSMDLMLNGWLLYQTLASRMWARCGFYQASGAYGFRDQLQDSMALTAAAPALAREHLLRAASRQFAEGDVQHWWLPDSGQGVRTRISDDRVWLPFAVTHYLTMTGETAVLDELVPFLAGSALEPQEAERFFQPPNAEEAGSLYEHCARALDASLALGSHGLPLIGAGDWNDGFNRVGEQGRGESVWLAWFLHATIKGFAPIAKRRGDAARAERWRGFASGIAQALEREAWDGDWYRRGWFDDGTPLGSVASEECRIDSIAQSWAVLSGCGRPERATHAMAALERELILPKEGLALLFAPPFDRTALDPGYIKGYPPGVRENGGQYTHAACWSVMAFAVLGDGDKAANLFSLLNPINHAHTRIDVHRYKVEPYVVAADVYSAAPHIGRGGWTWYTGSSGWMQRAGVESILGLRLRAGFLEIDPCIPHAWPAFQALLKWRTASYEVRVSNPNRVCRGVSGVTVDGEPWREGRVRVPLSDDGEAHLIEVTIG